MGPIRTAAARADVSLRRVGGLDLVAFEDVPRLLASIRDLGWRVLGIEGFRLHGGRIVPCMDAIADWSALSGSEASDRSVEASLRYLGSVGEPGMLFDLTLEASNHRD